MWQLRRRSEKVYKRSLFRASLNHQRASHRSTKKVMRIPGRPEVFVKPTKVEHHISPKAYCRTGVLKVATTDLCRNRKPGQLSVIIGNLIEKIQSSVSTEAQGAVGYMDTWSSRSSVNRVGTISTNCEECLVYST